eukprot:symbB.v1.2.020892.t2/scaffold1778.1/size101634/12
MSSWRWDRTHQATKSQVQIYHRRHQKWPLKICLKLQCLPPQREAKVVRMRRRHFWNPRLNGALSMSDPYFSRPMVFLIESLARILGFSDESSKQVLRFPGNCNGKATALSASSLAEALQAARIPRLAEVKPCAELRRLAQEVGLPTCVASSNKLIGVGTLRGAVVLLDSKLMDIPAKPQVLSPGEEASAVTSAAFSIDGGSLLVGHKSGQLTLWDLASQKIACIVQDVHSSAVLSLAFCRPSWQYALSADAKGSVYFISFFTGTFGRLDFEKQLLLEQSSNIGVTLRVLPLQVSSQQNHPADTHCLVALCASSATVLLTLHPSASVVQKIQYNAKDASWVPDATWLRMEPQDWVHSTQADAVDPQLCVAYGQTVHIMRVTYGMNEAKGKEEFKVSLAGRYSWGSPIRGLVSFNDSVVGILDGANSVVQLPSEARPAGTIPLSAVHSEDTTNWSLVFHTTPVDGREMRSHHGALSVFRGRSRTLYICGMKEVWSFQIGRWGQHIESVVARNDWSTALDVLLALRRGSLPPLLDFPHATTPRENAVESRITQVIQSYLVNTLRPDAARFQVRQICCTAINVCIEAELWPVLYKTVFECFKATGHMNVYCTALEPFIVHGRIPRKEMDSEVLSSILQSYSLPLEEEEQASQHTQDKDGSSFRFRDLDHCPTLFPVARRLQQLVLCVDVSRLDLNLAIRLFTQHRLWTALVHVYCALGDYVSPLELLVGECTQLAKRCSVQDSLPEEAPLLQCLLVRKLFFFIHRCFELRAFPLEPKDALGLVQPSPNAITDLLACIFKTSDPSKVPPMFLRLLRLSSLGRAMQEQAAAGKISWWKDTQQGSLLKALFELIQSSLEAAKTQCAEEGNPLPAHTEKEFLWFVARSLPRARAQLPIEKVMQVVDHVLSWPQGRQRKVEQLLIGVLATQDCFDDEHSAAVISKATNGFWGLAAWLHERSGEYGKALDCRLQDPELREQIFEYIIAKLAEELNPALIEASLQRLQALVDVDNELCSLMLCEQFANVPDHSIVLDSLKPYPQMEMRYLEALLLRWAGVADRQASFNMHVVRYIDLLCQHCPCAVLPFILENEALPLRECLELCGRYRVTDASVHLLERTGDFSSCNCSEIRVRFFRAAAGMFQVLRGKGLRLGVAGVSSAAGLAYWHQERKPVVRCETDAATLGVALVGGLGAGALGGYFFGKKQGESAAEKYEKYWPRKIMMLFGAPGAGKGTQGPKIVDTLDIPQLSTGDMLREAVAAKTEVGKKAQAVMSSGGLVSDEIVIGIIADRIKQPDCQSGFILDGFPRTLAQAQALDAMLAKNGEAVSLIVEFSVDPAVLEERICGRWMHKASGRSYHVKFTPPKSMKVGADGKVVPESMKDDLTGEALYQRSDDTAEALKTRLDAYKNQTLPILEHYKDKGIVKKVDGGKDIKDVWTEVQAKLVSK